VSPTRRRQTVAEVMTAHDLSERRACRALGVPRSTLRYPGVGPGRDKDLLLRIEELAREHPRYGYRRVTALLRRDGWAVNLKRVHRLWRAAGLKVPQAQRKRRRVGSSENGCTRHRAERPNHVWSYDFVMDQTSDGKRLKILPVIDEFTRRCLAIEVERSMVAEDVISTLEYLFELHGEPEHIRSDNGPEFVAEAVRGWLAGRGSKTLSIAPGSPWENAYSESFNSRFRDEFLDREVFGTLKEARVLIEDHRREYNDHRPHSSLNYLTPAAFAAAYRQPTQAPADSVVAEPKPESVLS
jgi:putative transposase